MRSLLCGVLIVAPFKIEISLMGWCDSFTLVMLIGLNAAMNVVGDDIARSYIHLNYILACFSSCIGCIEWDLYFEA